MPAFNSQSSIMIIIIKCEYPRYMPVASCDFKIITFLFKKSHPYFLDAGTGRHAFFHLNLSSLPTLCFIHPSTCVLCSDSVL